MLVLVEECNKESSVLFGRKESVLIAMERIHACDVLMVHKAPVKEIVPKSIEVVADLVGHYYQDIEVDTLADHRLYALFDITTASCPIVGASEEVVESRKAICRDADKHSLLPEEFAPLVIEQRSICLEEPAYGHTSCVDLLGKCEKASEPVEAYEAWLAALKADMDSIGPIEDLHKQIPRSIHCHWWMAGNYPVRGLIAVEAVCAIQVAGTACRLDHQ